MQTGVEANEAAHNTFYERRLGYNHMTHNHGDATYAKDSELGLRRKEIDLSTRNPVISHTTRFPAYHIRDQ